MEIKVIFISIVVCVVGLVAITAAPQFHQWFFVPQQQQQHVKTDCQNKTLYSYTHPPKKEKLELCH
jgi:hypothetical protein